MERVMMRPEGSRKVAVLNGSRQLDKVIGGQWVTLNYQNGRGSAVPRDAIGVSVSRSRERGGGVEL